MIFVFVLYQIPTLLSFAPNMLMAGCTAVLKMSTSPNFAGGEQRFFCSLRNMRLTITYCLGRNSMVAEKYIPRKTTA